MTASRSIDMSRCPRCDEPMAAVVSAPGLSRYVCRPCGFIRLPLDLAASVVHAPAGLGYPPSRQALQPLSA